MIAYCYRLSTDLMIPVSFGLGPAVLVAVGAKWRPDRRGPEGKVRLRGGVTVMPTFRSRVRPLIRPGIRRMFQAATVVALMAGGGGVATGVATAGPAGSSVSALASLPGSNFEIDSDA